MFPWAWPVHTYAYMPSRRLFATLALVAAACSAAPAAEPGPEQANLDLVTQARFDRARALLEAVDYLPFEYLFDGCTARALYMSMELATEGIESSAVFAYADGASLRVKNASWGFHVAPMFVVGDDRSSARRIVVDPSIDRAPLTQAQWIRRMGIAQEPGQPGYPRVFVVAGSDFWPADEASALPDGDVPDFASLPPFDTKDVLEACNVAYKWIGQEPGPSDAARADKRARLVARSGELVTRLRARGKVKDTLDAPLDGGKLERECVGKPKYTGVD
jgi:hypothetical protein